jgi:AraC-like DNA-binding protein
MLKKLHRMRISENVLTAAEKEKVDRYKRVASYIQKHFSEHIVLERLAEEANCTPQHLCAFFKEITGIPPIQYLIGYRVERARMMLRDTTKSVTEVCLDCGFENVSYFIRRFKQLTGMTPREYRKAKT